MKCEEITRRLNEAIPEFLAEQWDNVGLLIGDPAEEVQTVLVALDASDQVLDQAKKVGADMLITHHPLLFSAVKTIREDDFIGRRIRRIIRDNLSYYAMHTDYDICRMADLAAEKMELVHSEVLAVTGKDEKTGRVQGFGKVGDLSVPMTLQEYASFLRENFALPGVLVYGDVNRMIRRAAVCPGSGKSFGAEAVASGADVYVTGDVDYHFGTDLNEKGIAVIDAGHYGIEHIFIEDMRQYVEVLLDNQVKVFAMPVEHPYTVV